MYTILYKTTNLVNGKTYIGVHDTVTPFTFDGYLGSGKVLNFAIKRHGKDAFKRETLVVCGDREYALLLEKRFVDKDFIADRSNYNLAIGGSSCSRETIAAMTGIKCSLASNKKKSKALKGNKNALGFKHTEEVKAQMSIDRNGNTYSLGCEPSDETKAKMSKSQKAAWELRRKKAEERGYFLTEAQRAHLSSINTGKKLSKECREKISAKGKLRKMSEKTREALKKANVGRKHSEETKEKIRQKALNRAAKKLVTEPVTDIIVE